jgi:exopolysaccharide biosynthesis polyprenyl glycosylphosphotransferase
MSTRIVERTALVGTSAAKRAPEAYPAGWTFVLLVTDVALFILASVLGALIGFHHWESARIVRHLLIAEVLFVALWVLVFHWLGLYRRTYALTRKDELYYTIAALSLGSIPQLVLFTIFPEISTSRIALLFALLFSIALVGTSRSVLHGLRESPRFRRSRRMAIVGTTDRVQRAYESLDLDDSCEALLIEVDDIEAELAQAPVLTGELESIEWFSKSRAWGCDMLVLTEMIPPELTGHFIEVAARHQMQIAFAPPRITRHAYSLSLQTNGRQALIVPSRLRACTPRAQLFKRILDVVFTLVALVIFAPVMILAAIAVYVDSGLPIHYLQQRVGVGGKTFNIFKFRSMRSDAEERSGAVWAKHDDPRRTRIGTLLRRFSIDELPQFFNVLRGEMSLVGPRPERPVFVDLFRRSIPRYEERHLIRPGITGWSQIHMKRVLETSAAQEKLEYDLQYLENWSPFLDLSVLFQTLFEFAFHRAG